MGLKCGTERNGYGVKMRNGTDNNNNFIYNRQPTSLLKCFSAGLCILHSIYYYIKKLKVLFYIEKSRLY